MKKIIPIIMICLMALSINAQIVFASEGGGLTVTEVQVVQQGDGDGFGDAGTINNGNAIKVELGGSTTEDKDVTPPANSNSTTKDSDKSKNSKPAQQIKQETPKEVTLPNRDIKLPDFYIPPIPDIPGTPGEEHHSECEFLNFSCKYIHY